MAARIARAAERAGVASEGVSTLLVAYTAAMTPRESGPSAPPTDKHPVFLHPGRTVLILLEDLGETDACVLAVGALAESRDQELRADPVDVAQALAGFADRAAETFQWWERLPTPLWRQEVGAITMKPSSDQDFLERAVTAPEPLRRVVLSEALDHLRHAHLWPSKLDRARAVQLAERVLAPVADRTHPVLARRFAWWIRRVGPGLKSVKD